MATHNFDIVIVGGGPGGYVTAVRSSQLGFKTALVEKENLGGICLNWGCIPTKSLLHSSELYNSIQVSQEFGINLKGTFDLATVVKRSRDVANQLSNGVKFLMKKYKVTVFSDKAVLQGANRLVLYSGDILQSTHTILATGARARLFSGVKPHDRIWTYRKALVPKTLPKKLVIIGTGAIGVEFGAFYNRLGVEVTLLEVGSQILLSEDKEIANLAQKQYEKQGMKIMVGVNIQGITPTDSNVTLKGVSSDKKPFEMVADNVLLAIGIEGNVDNIGLETTKAKVEKSHIVINEWSQTAERNLYAIGDVAGPPWLAHKASHEGIICVEKIAGKKDVHPLNPVNIPGCIYTMPQIASVGLTEDKAKGLKYDIKVGKFPLMANGKAIILGESTGMVKTIFDKKTGELLGAHMIGPEVSEMIQGFVVGKTMEGTEVDFMESVFPHPTVSESMCQSVKVAFGVPTDI